MSACIALAALALTADRRQQRLRRRPAERVIRRGRVAEPGRRDLGALTSRATMRRGDREVDTEIVRRACCRGRRRARAHPVGPRRRRHAPAAGAAGPTVLSVQDDGTVTAPPPITVVAAPAPAVTRPRPSRRRSRTPSGVAATVAYDLAIPLSGAAEGGATVTATRCDAVLESTASCARAAPSRAPSSTTAERSARRQQPSDDLTHTLLPPARPRRWARPAARATSPA
jgi:hypothetical protein